MQRTDESGLERFRNRLARPPLIITLDISRIIVRMTKWIALFALVLVAVGAVFVMERRAKQQAMDFCDRFKIGDLFVDVQRAAVDIKHREVLPDQVAVAYMGFGAFPSHICIVNAVDGKVARTRYRYD